MIQNKFLKVAQEGHFFDKHTKVLVAVSGGKDSMNLFQLLFDFQEKLQIEIGMIHVNHQQRLSSDEEEHYLEELCYKKKIPFFSRHFSGTFSEKKARDFRYDFFKEIMEQENYTALVTAHHANDQAETILMRLIRGSRLLDLSGIVAVQAFGNGELIRPLLSFKKKELANLYHFEDSSNQELNYFRNRVRNHYIPSLKKENPRFDAALLHLGGEIALAKEALKDLTKEMDSTNLAVFRQQSPAVQYFLFQHYLENFPTLQLTQAQCEECLQIIRKKANYAHHLKGDYYFVKDYQHFSITKIQPQTDDIQVEGVIESQGIYEYGSFMIARDVPLEQAEQVLFVENSLPIHVRNRKKGDRIIVNGMSKKIRRYFIDEKIDQSRRKQALILEQNGKVYGIANIVASDLSKSLKNDTIKSTIYIKMKE